MLDYLLDPSLPWLYIAMVLTAVLPGLPLKSVRP